MRELLRLSSCKALSVIHVLGVGRPAEAVDTIGILETMETHMILAASPNSCWIFANLLHLGRHIVVQEPIQVPV